MKTSDEASALETELKNAIRLLETKPIEEN